MIRKDKCLDLSIITSKNPDFSIITYKSPTELMDDWIEETSIKASKINEKIGQLKKVLLYYIHNEIVKDNALVQEL